MAAAELEPPCARLLRAGAQALSDAELLADAHERDPGFDREMFAQQLQRVRRFGIDDVERHGLDAAGLEQLRDRFTTWAQDLREPAPAPERTARDRLRASYPLDPTVTQAPAARADRSSAATPAKAVHRAPYGVER